MVDEIGIINRPIYGLLTQVLLTGLIWDKETFLLHEGNVMVNPMWVKPVKFGAGDLVTLLALMNCRWDVHQAVT